MSRESLRPTVAGRGAGSRLQLIHATAVAAPVGVTVCRCWPQPATANLGACGQRRRVHATGDCRNRFILRQIDAALQGGRFQHYPTVESLLKAWGTVERHVRDFLSNLKDEDLIRTVEFTNPRGEKRSGVLGALLQHGATHGVHHRGQVALLLRSLGYAPGNFDLLFYDAEKHRVSAW